jgi:hypothetical protein
MALTYEDEDALCHKADDDPWWQESVALAWWDDRAGIGGFTRIGQEVGQGSSTVWMGVVTADGRRFRYCESALPLSEADRNDDGVVAGDGSTPVAAALRAEGGLHWRMDRPGLSADLALRDFYPMTNLWTLGSRGSAAEQIAPHHWEASGRLTGTVRLGSSTYDVDALYHRDHSWGTRHWDTIRAHRWVAGTCGPELSFIALTWYSRDGRLGRDAFVNRHGESTMATAVDVVAWVELDGTSTRGGTLRLELEDGSTVALEAHAVDGIVSTHRGIACVDTISRVRTDSGLTGFCDFETTHNSQLGTEPLALAVAAGLENGLSERR